MKNKIGNESIVRAGFVILIANAIYQIANFLYHFFSARMLGPAEYSIVASLFSIIYLVGMGSMTIQNTITKFTAKFKAENEKGKISYLFHRGSRKLFIYSIILTAIFLCISPLIANFLKIPIIPILIISPFIILAFLIPINRGVLQGIQNFKALGLNLILEGMTKLILALLLIYLGFKANGAIFAVLVSLIVAFIFTFPSLKFKKEKTAKIDSKEIYKFSIISFMALFLITAIYNVDIFLVKHFFSAEQAGHYAVLSLLGKIIFFGATSIGLVMFPKISAQEKEKDKNKKVFKKSIIFTSIISVFIAAIYYLFSKQIVSIAFGQNYIDISGMLGAFGIFMVFLSLSYICILHKLAIGKKKFIINILIALLLEIILIVLFHATLSQIVTSLIILNILLFISLLN